MHPCQQPGGLAPINRLAPGANQLRPPAGSLAAQQPVSQQLQIPIEKNDWRQPLIGASDWRRLAPELIGARRLAPIGADWRQGLDWRLIGARANLIGARSQTTLL